MLRGGPDAADGSPHARSPGCTRRRLGSVESTFERRRRWNAEPDTIPAGLVRLSVGIEDVEDLWADLAQALA